MVLAMAQQQQVLIERLSGHNFALLGPSVMSRWRHTMQLPYDTAMQFPYNIDCGGKQLEVRALANTECQLEADRPADSGMLTSIQRPASGTCAIKA